MKDKMRSKAKAMLGSSSFGAPQIPQQPIPAQGMPPQGFSKGGKSTKKAKGGCVKMAAGGAAKIRHGAASPEGAPIKPTKPSAKEKMTKPKASG